ncbi:10140_t:CDS:2, partial [Dentiscutata heterogama]
NVMDEQKEFEPIQHSFEYSDKKRCRSSPEDYFAELRNTLEI